MLHWAELKFSELSGAVFIYFMLYCISNYGADRLHSLTCFVLSPRTCLPYLALWLDGACLRLASPSLVMSYRLLSCLGLCCGQGCRGEAFVDNDKGKRNENDALAKVTSESLSDFAKAQAAVVDFNVKVIRSFTIVCQ